MGFYALYSFSFSSLDDYSEISSLGNFFDFSESSEWEESEDESWVSFGQACQMLDTNAHPSLKPKSILYKVSYLAKC